MSNSENYSNDSSNGGSSSGTKADSKEVEFMIKTWKEF